MQFDNATSTVINNFNLSFNGVVPGQPWSHPKISVTADGNRAVVVSHHGNHFHTNVGTSQWGPFHSWTGAVRPGAEVNYWDHAVEYLQSDKWLVFATYALSLPAGLHFQRIWCELAFCFGRVNGLGISRV